MLEIDTLSVNKRIFNPNESDQSKSIGIWDLTQSSVNYDIEFMNSRKVFRVTSDMVMRPDLISLYQIGDSDYCGSMMKVNGISNPFSIGEGRLLFIITPQMIRKTYDRKKDEVYISYEEIWTVLQSNFYLSLFETKRLTQEWLSEVYNLRGVTTVAFGDVFLNRCLRSTI